MQVMRQAPQSSHAPASALWGSERGAVLGLQGVGADGVHHAGEAGVMVLSDPGSEKEAI